MRDPQFALAGPLGMTMMLLISVLSLSAVEDPSQPSNVDRILVEKSKRTLTLYNGGKVVKTYLVALGGEPVGPKEKEGDHKTPEGSYTIDSKNARSRFHLALHVSYPDEADRKRARKLGVSPGSAIMIHGLPKEFAYLGA